MRQRMRRKRRRNIALVVDAGDIEPAKTQILSQRRSVGQEGPEGRSYP